MNWELLYKMEREFNQDLVNERAYYYKQAKMLEKKLEEYKDELCVIQADPTSLSEEVDVLSGENRNFANFLEELGLDDDKISSIANGGDYEIVSNINIYISKG